MTKIVFYVIVFDQIRISICQAHQNDNQNLSFMRNINVVAKKMARNGLKIANSLGCAFHFESDFSPWSTYLGAMEYMVISKHLNRGGCCHGCPLRFLVISVSSNSKKCLQMVLVQQTYIYTLQSLFDFFERLYFSDH